MLQSTKRISFVKREERDREIDREKGRKRVVGKRITKRHTSQWQNWIHQGNYQIS